MFLSQGRRYSSWLLFSLYKDSKWHETVATLKSTNISAFFFSVQNFPLVFDELQNYPHASSTPKHHVLVILYQVALLSFWESCSTRKPTLSSTGHLVPSLGTHRFTLASSILESIFFSASVFLMGFTPGLALTEYFIQGEPGPRMTQQNNSASLGLFHRWITQLAIKAVSSTYW